MFSYHQNIMMAKRRPLIAIAITILFFVQCMLLTLATSPPSPPPPLLLLVRSTRSSGQHQHQHHRQQRLMRILAGLKRPYRQWKDRNQQLCTTDLLLLESLRGGALGANKAKTCKSPAQSDRLALIQAPCKKTVLSLTSLLVLILSIQHWETIKRTLATLFDGAKFRSTILQTLNNIASMGNAGLLLYTITFVFWEVCGLPTSVVETAAGMTFGLRKAFISSFVGKSCGSSLAFLLGRTVFSDMVRQKLETIEYFSLFERGVEHHPLRSAFIVRYSPFPQIIKNFGISMTKPVSYPIFLLTIIVHGMPFSLLWAALGHDSSMRLRASSQLGRGEAGALAVPTNHILNGLLVFVTVFGFVVSPVITGWWLADVRKEK